MTVSATKNSFLAYASLAMVCIVWGTTFLAIRIGVTEFPAFLFSVIRQIIGGGILSIIMLTFGKVKWPEKQVIINQAIGGLFLITLGNGLIGYAEIYVSSGLAAIICSMMPIWVILINLVSTKDERPSLPVMFGMAMGLGGILIIFREHLAEFSNSTYTLGIFICFFSNFCWALGSVITKRRNQNSNPFLNAGLQMFFGGLFLIPLSLLFDDYSRIQWTQGTVYSLLYLILIGSVIAYACYQYAIKTLSITIVSLYAYINPLVAILLGWIILDERFNTGIAIGMIVTIGGIYVVNRSYQAKTQLKTQLSGK
jgi:drug/metabolite transporter (DMT)-like permease